VAETPSTAALIARAIVHLNFNEPEKAIEALFDALTEVHFTREKESTDGNRTAAA
jgi:hypothetical protein